MARPKKNVESFTLPSNPKDIQSIRDSIYEIEGALSFIQDKKEFIKDVYLLLEEKFNMPKELVSKMVKAHQEDKFDEIVEKNEQFEFSYEKIMTITSTMQNEESESEESEEN